MTDDGQLLRRYAETRSETAFAELVRRHLDLVYSAALRRTSGDAHRAEEIAQQVFIAVARRAESLSRHPVLAGWLYTATRNTAIDLLRSEQRRKIREKEAHAMQTMSSESAASGDWGRIRPVLDEAMDGLGERDRAAVLLRFFENRPYAAVASDLGMKEDAARKRVERALQKIHAFLLRRGVTSTTAALELLLAGEATASAPASVLASVTTFATGPAGMPVSGFSLLKIMSATKLTAGAAAFLGIAAILSLSVAGFAAHEYARAKQLDAAWAEASRALQSDQVRLRRLEETAAAAEQKRTALQARVERADRAAASARARTPSAAAAHPARSPSADGQAFLAAYPQAREMLMELGRAQIARSYAAFYRSAGLTPQQIEEFEVKTAQQWMDTAVVAPGAGIHPGQNQLPDDQLRQIFGDTVFPQFQNYEREVAAQTLAVQFSAAGSYAGAPIPAPQANQLAQIITANSAEFQNGGEAKLTSVDWSGVESQAQAALTPAQFHAVDPIILRLALMQAMGAAQPKP